MSVSAYVPSHPAALGPGACSRLAVVVAEVAPDWVVEFHNDPFGRSTIVVQPNDDDDATSPTLIIHADHAAFHVDEWNGDDCRKVGEYCAWADVLRAVQVRLIWELPVPPTLH